MGFGHVIPHLVERFLGNEIKFKIYGADQTRSFCYIDDGALEQYKLWNVKLQKRNFSYWI